MKYDIIDEKFTEKSCSAKKRKEDDQENPLDLEDFEYDIPQLPIVF